MIDNRTASAIDLAFQIHHTPVGNLFVAMRHGRMKRCFSRDTAIRYLAFFMTTEAFRRSGFEQRYGCAGCPPSQSRTELLAARRHNS
jgi:hypothetical protein